MLAVSVFFPVYNEQDILAANIEKTRAYLQALASPYEIIIGSNGSTDGTCAIGQRLQQSYPEIRFFHIPDKAPGAAFRQAARLMRHDVLISLDMDLSTDLSFIRNATQALEHADIIVGSKKMGHERRRLVRRWGSDLFIWCSIRLLGLPFKDYSLGAKAYRKSALLKYGSDLDDGTFYVQRLIYHAWRDGLRIVEIPIECEDYRKSRFNLMREGFYRFARLFELWFLEKFHRRSVS